MVSLQKNKKNKNKKLQSWRTVMSCWLSNGKLKWEEPILWFVTRRKSASGIKYDHVWLTTVCSVCSGPLMDHGCERGRMLVWTGVKAYLWHTGSTSPRWRGSWGARSSWRCSGCCRSWCDGWGRHCLLQHSCLLCDRPPGSGYNASDDLDVKQRSGGEDSCELLMSCSYDTVQHKQSCERMQCFYNHLGQIP